MNITEYIYKTVKDFLNNPKENSLEIKSCPNDMLTAIEKAGGTVDHDTMDVDGGWEGDWSCQGSFKEQKLHISGGAWYGKAYLEKED